MCELYLWLRIFLSGGRQKVTNRAAQGFAVPSNGKALEFCCAPNWLPPLNNFLDWLQVFPILNTNDRSQGFAKQTLLKNKTTRCCFPLRRMIWGEFPVADQSGEAQNSFCVHLPYSKSTILSSRSWSTAAGRVGGLTAARKKRIYQMKTEVSWVVNSVQC